MYIVTGGAGFIGSAMLWRLNRAGITDIMVVDNLGSTDKWKNLVNRRYTRYVHRDQFMDMLHANALDSSIEAVLHFGACSATTQADADFLMANNTAFSIELCKFAPNTMPGLSMPALPPLTATAPKGFQTTRLPRACSNR